GVVLESATVSFTKTTEETVHAELYIGGDQTSDPPPSFDAALLDPAAPGPRVADVLGGGHERATVNGSQDYVAAANGPAALGSIFGATPVAGAIAPLGPKQVIVDDTAAAAMGLRPGSTVSIGLTRGEPSDYTVAGVYKRVDGYVSGIVMSDAARASFA